MPPAKPPDWKSQKNEISLTGSPNDSSEDEMPMVQALEEQPTATATKNGVSQLTGFTSSFAKDLERSAKNGPSSIKPNPIPKQKGARSCSQDREVPEIEDPRKTSGCRRASEEKTRISKETWEIREKADRLADWGH